MPKVTRTSIALAAVCSLFAASANATIVVQAGAGHPHLTSGSASWDSEWATSNAFTIIDGRTIFVTNSNRVWDTPVPITATNVNWNIAAFGFSDPVGDSVRNRICTFDFAGNFFGCGATVAAQSTGSAPDSTAFVPSNGSAYSQTFFNVAGGHGSLFHVIAH